MKPAYCFLFILMCCISISSCSQNKAPGKNFITDVFTGSTPCNLTVNKKLGIPASDTCDYMTWELSVSGKDSSFKLIIAYGAYLPNTMYFLNGGKSMGITGKLKTTYLARNNTKYKILHLINDAQIPELLFIKMDDNILHLIDINMNFIKGDAGHGFVLNRVNLPQSN